MTPREKRFFVQTRRTGERQDCCLGEEKTDEEEGGEDQDEKEKTKKKEEDCFVGDKEKERREYGLEH